MRIRFQCLFLAVLTLSVFFLSSSVCAEDEAQITGYLIRKITIVRDNVFDLSNPEESGTIGRVGNAIHIVTKEKVIRAELLFAEGELFDNLKVEETERNLRRYTFLADIWIRVVPDHENKSVDITVHSRDQWSLIVGGSFGGTDENPKVGLDFGDKNLFGQGQTLKYQLSSSNEGTTHSFGFKDETLFDSDYLFEIDHAFKENTSNTSFQIMRPFRSLQTPESTRVSSWQDMSDDPISGYARRRVQIEHARLWHYSRDLVTRIQMRGSYGELYRKERSVQTPMERDSKLLAGFAFLFDPYSYETTTYLEKYREKEDVPLGLSIGFLAGRTIKTMGASDNYWSAEVNIRKNFRYENKDILKTNYSFSRNDDRFNRRYSQFTLLYYCKRFKNHMPVFNAEFIRTNSDLNTITLGGTQGLRGYQSGEFNGSGSVVFNIEDRIFTFTTWFSGIFEPGFVIFNDWGRIWDSGENPFSSGFQGSVGVGLRLAILKAPGVSLIRLDYGKSITRSSNPVVTIGMEGFF